MPSISFILDNDFFFLVGDYHDPFSYLQQANWTSAFQCPAIDTIG
jgi:hypothetical protein